MVFAQFKSLYLWLLLFSLALRDSIGSAQHDSVTVTVDTEAIRWDKSFYDEAKYRSGRRMGALWKGEEKSRIQNTGANPFVGKCVQHDQLHEGKGKLNIECKTSGFRISHPSNVKLFGKMPFNADYYSPKTHPPKHN
ncbi:hypothetical protein MA16_Dca003241 [Dendrobium catenatum]|uniref:Uncharacterized protein n=1 Tax=Dendrobium catenatum TaxID=906689 RepID=A0A2I0XC63_9ASPA|nr:hypothetical protein MA16_Dca003241 [Dendrobium catenatum]